MLFGSTTETVRGYVCYLGSCKLPRNDVPSYIHTFRHWYPSKKRKEQKELRANPELRPMDATKLGSFVTTTFTLSNYHVFRATSAQSSASPSRGLARSVMEQGTSQTTGAIPPHPLSTRLSTE